VTTYQKRVRRHEGGGETEGPQGPERMVRFGRGLHLAAVWWTNHQLRVADAQRQVGGGGGSAML
jgi:hypothetical protein